MSAQFCYKMNAGDTKEIRNILKSAGLDVKQCRLGSNRFYAQIHTSDNTQAMKVLAQSKYVPSIFDTKTPAEIRNITDIMIRKVQP